MKKTRKNVELNNPRHAAFILLEQMSESQLHADRMIDQTLTGSAMKGVDRALFTELIMGVLRQQGTIDHYLQQLLDRPLDRLEGGLLILLRLGIYQLRFLDRVPEHAAVNETVTLAAALKPAWKGMVNAVLRSYQRQSEQLTLPDSSESPARWLAAKFSLPAWLAESWLSQMPFEEATLLAAASLEKPPLTIRCNSLKTDREQLIRMIEATGLQAVPCRFAAEGIQIIGQCTVTALPGFKEGYFMVQDESSQLVSHLLMPLPGESLLDICAAPGGKTTHLAQLMNDTGQIVATDLDKRRIRRIEENIARLGSGSINVMVADALSPDYQAGQMFDRILLDAPCSGLGVIRRNPEAKWRLNLEEIERCARRQRQLLDVAAAHLKPGGHLLYATCSTSVLENETVIEDFLSTHPEFMLDTSSKLLKDHPELAASGGYMRCWPHRHNMDGFFAATVKRII